MGGDIRSGAASRKAHGSSLALVDAPAWSRRIARSRSTSVGRPTPPPFPSLYSPFKALTYLPPVCRAPVCSRRMGKCVSDLSEDSGGVRPIWRCAVVPATHPRTRTS